MLSYKRLKALTTAPYEPIEINGLWGEFEYNNLFIFNKENNSLECRLKCNSYGGFGKDSHTTIYIGFDYIDKPESNINITFDTLPFNRLFDNVSTANCLMEQVFEIVADCKEYCDIAEGIKLVGWMSFKDFDSDNAKDCTIKFYDNMAKKYLVESHYFMVKGDSASYTADEILKMNFNEAYIIYVV